MQRRRGTHSVNCAVVRRDSTGTVSWAKSLRPCCATTDAWFDGAANCGVSAVAVHRRSSTSLSFRSGRSPWSRLLSRPSCSMLPGGRCPCCAGRSMPVVVQRQVLMVQILQKTVEVTQAQDLRGCGRRCDLAATSSRQCREVPQICSSTRCSSSEEG